MLKYFLLFLADLLLGERRTNVLSSLRVALHHSKIYRNVQNGELFIEVSKYLDMDVRIVGFQPQSFAIKSEISSIYCVLRYYRIVCLLD